MRVTPLTMGEPAPWFVCPTGTRQNFHFDTVGGRYLVLAFLGSVADAAAARLIEDVTSRRSLFDDVKVSFFGVSVDPEDEQRQRLADSVPGVRYFRDFDRSVSALYGAVQADGAYRPMTYVLDPAMRVLAVLPLQPLSSGARETSLFELLDRLPPIPPPYVAPVQAPVLVLPRIFERKLCRALIDHYDSNGGRESGFMRDVNGKTVEIRDPSFKRRRDCTVEDEALRNACMVRIHDRLIPQLRKAFQFGATRMERYIVSCYDAKEQGHFQAHRDNTTMGTAHRRFAVSLFLNSGEYDGGYLCFPEFGSALYSAPAGGAVVFSCSLLHEATTVTRGRRYMFLPFLYDEAAKRIRDENEHYLE